MLIYIPVVLLTIHVGYLLRSKGYKAFFFCRNLMGCTIFLGVFVPMFLNREIEAYQDTVWMKATLLSLPLLPPLIGWLVVKFLLKKKPLAPGSDYFVIRFDCPLCGQKLTFDRKYENLIKPCSGCGEPVVVTEILEVHQKTKADHQRIIEAFENPEKIWDDRLDIPDQMDDPECSFAFSEDIITGIKIISKDQT